MEGNKSNNSNREQAGAELCQAQIRWDTLGGFLC